MSTNVTASIKRAFCVGAGVVGLAVFGVAAFRAQAAPAAPVFSRPAEITNPYLPLGSLGRHVFEGTHAGRPARTERTRLPGTRAFTVGGQTVNAMIVEDRGFVDGRLEEVALDYFAQSDDGTVYYLGETVDNYRNGKVADHQGTWLYGVHTKHLGVLMPAKPATGDRFQAENAAGIAREDVTIVSSAEKVSVPSGSYDGCLKAREVLLDGAIEHKFYCPKVGVVQEVTTDGTMRLKSRR